MKRYLRMLGLGFLLSLPWCGAWAQSIAIGPYNYLNITGDATAVVSSKPGLLHTVCFNNPVATEVITIYDGLTAATGTKIATITVPASPQPSCLAYDVAYGIGLVIVTATATSDITVSYR